MLQSQTAINASVHATVRSTLLNAFKHTMYSEILPLGKKNKFKPRVNKGKIMYNCVYIYIYMHVVRRFVIAAKSSV